MTWNWTLLRGGEFWLDAGAMFGIIPRMVWMRWLTPDERNRLPLQQNSMLLEGGGKRVLIETGIGDKFGAKERDIYSQEDRAIHDAVEEAGCRVEDVDAVILTHLHFDHAGGLTRRGPDDRPVLTFPNAEIIVQRQEWEDAIANRSTMHKTYLRNHLTPDVAERVRLVDGECEALPGITVWPTPGHTWGQQAVRFEDEKGYTRVFVPDVMPTRWHRLASACMAYDVETWTSQQERIRLLKRASEERWRLTLVHEHGHPHFISEPDPDKPGAWRLNEAHD
ncbi:MAG: MBL fold metallo-hydrolase [Phycisphaerales bacterium]